MLNTAPGVLVYRGSTRAPIEQEVAQALEEGLSVIRVKLAPEAGPLVTAFVR